MKHTAKIAGVTKAVEDTGITEELAKRLWDRLGSSEIAIVELYSTERTESVGERGVKLEVARLEPSGGDGEIAELLRELERALYRTRTGKGVQRTLDELDGVEKKPSDVLREGRGLLLVREAESSLSE